MTPLIIACSFAYIPFILRFENIASFFIRVTSVFVIPLMTVYLMGVFTPVHRRSGIIGLGVGSIYGILSLFGGSLEILPFWLTNKFVSYLWSITTTAGAMVITSLVLGKTPMSELDQLQTGGWLDRSRQDVPALVNSPFQSRGQEVPLWANPNLWAGLVMTASASLVFYFFW